jgi:putative FmdB family regulatory protein
MPLYDWACGHCGKTVEILRPVRQALVPVICDCGVPMLQQLSAVFVRGDITPYKAVTGDRAGQWISSRKEHREFLKRNRLVEAGDAKPEVKPFRKVHTSRDKREMREKMRAVIRQTLKPDTKRGGLIERKQTRRA